MVTSSVFPSRLAPRFRYVHGRWRCFAFSGGRRPRRSSVGWTSIRQQVVIPCCADCGVTLDAKEVAFSNGVMRCDADGLAHWLMA